jgi:hypothetical protein
MSYFFISKMRLTFYFQRTFCLSLRKLFSPKEYERVIRVFLNITIRQGGCGMMKRLATISVVFLIFGTVLGGPLVAKGEIVQSLLIGVKQNSGGGFTNADLNCTSWFRNLSFQNFETNNPAANITYGTVNFDGDGNWTGTATEFDSDGTTDSGMFNGTYSVNADGSFDFIIKGTAPDPDQTLTGHISRDADRQFGVLSQGEVSSGNIHQGIITFVRAPDHPFGLADLNGTWQERDLEVRDFEEDFREASACTGTIVINNPNWNGNFNCFESDGTTDIDTVSGTYTITGNTFDFFITGYSAVAFSAYLSRDGNILTFTHGSSSFGDIGLFKGIALKKTTKTYTNADLSGTYFFHDAYIEDFGTDNREFSITVGAVTFDGNGNWTGTGNSFDSDGSSGSGNISGNYSVNSDGFFTLIVTSEVPNGTLTGNISGDNNTIIMSQRESISIGGGNLVTSGLWIKAVINTVEKGPIEAVWKKGGEDTTSRGDRVIWGHFYASPSDVTWGSENNPDLFVKIWYDVSGRVDVNYFHVSVPDIEVYSGYPYDGTYDQQGTTTMSRRYIRQYYEGGQSYSDESYEDGNPPSGYSPAGNPSGYSTINDLKIGSIINTVEKGPIDAVWRLGGQDTTARGDQVVWGLFYASPSDVTWGSQNNPDLFVKIWFDVSGRVDVNFFHVSVPDIEVYSDLPNDGTFDQKGTTIMDNRYIRHEYWR